jgi:hypothetical protein
VTRKMNDEELAEAAHRLKERTGAGFRTRPRETQFPGMAFVWVERAEGPLQGFIDMVRGQDGTWHVPWIGASDDGNKQPEPGCAAGSNGIQPYQK